MYQPKSAIGLPSGFPLLAVLAYCYGFFAFLMLVFVQLNVTLPLEAGEFNNWLGEDFPVMIAVCVLWMILLAVDAVARGNVLGKSNRSRLVANGVAVILMGTLAFNLSQWQGF